MKPEISYLIGRLKGYGAASALLFAVLSGCSTRKEVSGPQPTQYRVPQAHIEIHKQLLSEQHKLIISKDADENIND